MVEGSGAERGGMNNEYTHSILEGKPAKRVARGWTQRTDGGEMARGQASVLASPLLPGKKQNWGHKPMMVPMGYGTGWDTGAGVEGARLSKR